MNERTHKVLRSVSRASLRGWVATAYSGLLSSGLGLIGVTLLVGSAYPQTIQQMVHSSWTSGNGAPPFIRGMAQGPDGRLWLASDAGLFSFDGVTFTAFSTSLGQPKIPPGGVKDVAFDHEGVMWLATNSRGIVRVKNDRVTIFDRAEDEPILGVNYLRVSPDGQVWAVVDGKSRIVRVDNEGAHAARGPLRPESKYLGIFFDSHGTEWLSGDGRLYRRSSGTNDFSSVPTTLDINMGYGEAPDGSLWIGDSTPGTSSGRVIHLDTHGRLVSPPLTPLLVRAVLSSGDGSVWLADISRGLVRVGPKAQGSLAAVLSDNYQRALGLASIEIESLLEDREGNVWAGGDHGLDRFRRADVVPVVPNLHTNDWAACSDLQGKLWMGSWHNLMYSFEGNRLHQIPHAQDINFVACAENGDLLTLDHTGISVFRGQEVQHLPLIPGETPFSVRAVLEGVESSIFAVGRVGLWRYGDHQWKRLASPSPNVQGYSLYRDKSKTLWIGTDQGVLEGANDASKGLSLRELDLGRVTAFLDSSNGFFVAGMNGLAVRQGQTFRRLTFAEPDFSYGIGGIVQDADGNLWINGQRGITRIALSELLRALKTPNYAMHSEAKGEGDFAVPAQAQNDTPSAGQFPDHRLWFATTNGVVTIDPTRLHPRNTLPVVAIVSVRADGAPVSPGAAELKAPRTVSIQYSGISLATPDSVTYRYQLAGLEDEWQFAGKRTEATYSNLPPGRYAFRVAASNDGGPWSPSISTSSFDIRRPWYRSWWLISMETLACLGIVSFGYKVRLRIVAANVRRRAEARAEERLRIARDLHDTLLQGVQGLMLSLHVAAQHLVLGSEPRTQLERALAAADSLVVEGRDRVVSLRHQDRSRQPLEEQLRSFGVEQERDPSIALRVKGRQGNAVLTEGVAEELFLIGREALSNAFRHSGALSVLLTLTYSRTSLRLSCRDNGVGFDATRTEDFISKGHYGLVGMAERANVIGGTFTCDSSPGIGTEISVTVPARAAYRLIPRRTLRWGKTSSSESVGERPFGAE